MKRKSLLALTILAMLNSTTYAMEIYKGRLLNHTEKTSKDIKIISQPSHYPEQIQPLTLPDKALHSNLQNYTWLNTQLHPATSVAGTMANVQGRHGLYVRNTSDTTKSFWYVFEACVNLDEHNVQCAEIADQFVLSPDGYFQQFENPVLQVFIKNPGTYKTSAFSYVAYNDGTEGEITNHSSSSESIIEVSSGK